MAIQAWTGSGVEGPIDVMRPRGKGKAMDGTGALALGWLVEGLGWAGWDAPCLVGC